MEEIIRYVMETPENVNGNILREKLKEFKGSGGGAVFVDCTETVTENEERITATKTAGEIFNLIMDGNAVVFRLQNSQETLLMPCLGAINLGDRYDFYVFKHPPTVNRFSADTASDYPYISKTK